MRWRRHSRQVARAGGRRRAADHARAADGADQSGLPGARPRPKARRRWPTSPSGGPELVITDLYMPHMDGVELCRRIRAMSTVPIIVLSVKGEERTKVEALDSGADDYVTKPFGIDELLARVRAALRRSGGDAEMASFEAGDFRVDLEGRRVHARGNEVRLTPKEFELFVYMARHPEPRASRTARCSKRCGAKRRRSSPSTCACSWGSCARSSNRIPRTRDTSSPSPGSAIASILMARCSGASRPLQLQSAAWLHLPLPFPASASDVRSRTLAPARAPWSIYAVLFASTSVILGVIWDISWHRSIGRDTFWTPAHLAIYLGGIVAGLTCGWVALTTTFGGSETRRAARRSASGASARRSARGSASGARSRCSRRRRSTTGGTTPTAST